MIKTIVYSLFVITLFFSTSYAQELKTFPDSVTVQADHVKITIDKRSGLVNYLFSNGVVLKHTSAYLNDLNAGKIYSSGFSDHTCSIVPVHDKLGDGKRIFVTHSDNKYPFILIQSITIYQRHSYILVDVSAKNKHPHGVPLETRDISPIAILPQFGGKAFVPGTEPRILDVPFDNDDWVNVVERNWPGAEARKNTGISYEFAAVYDRLKSSGLVIGSVTHDFWKTGLAYQTAAQSGYIDSLKVFGGAATADNSSLPADYGGLDGTHDHLEHGTMTGQSVNSPTIYLNAMDDLHQAFVQYGEVNAILNGKQTWKGYAPVYWNSFGVEGVLGYEGVMMPPAVKQISDFIHSLQNFNAYAKPVLSIDSYDQKIYSTEVLKELGAYAEKNNQQMGFYFIPFAMWSWKDDIEGRKVPGSDYDLKDVLLHDKEGKPIMYKDGKWGAYAMDPTHPAIRLYIIQQLKKAKAINARFIKIDFLTAGALETSRRFDPKVRTGMQAYNYGMKTLRFLVDSIMGKDIFITQAISPMFPSQYADTRFISTDVYSHLRNDDKGFPHYGSTEASLASGSHMGWVQGTLWPYTNLDVSIMKNFQRNPDLSEQEIKVRMYAMMVMGSIYGDGSDFRNPLAAQRAQKFLNNKQLANFFKAPKAFVPIQAADGDSEDQQMSFYLPGETCTLALFNFDRKNNFQQILSRTTLHLKPHLRYELRDMLTNAIIGELKSDERNVKLSAYPTDAVMVKLIPVND
jgi:alpha-galactosidase